MYYDKQALVTEVMMVQQTFKLTEQQFYGSEKAFFLNTETLVWCLIVELNVHHGFWMILLSSQIFKHLCESERCIWVPFKVLIVGESETVVDVENAMYLDLTACKTSLWLRSDMESIKGRLDMSPCLGGAC